MVGGLYSGTIIATAALLFVGYFAGVYSHGMMLEPVNRASRWRYNSSAPIDYNDNAGYCGGFGAQWISNKGRCGLCGDNYADPTPRAHEYGGVYGEGVIVRTYTPGESAAIHIQITANHGGYFMFDLCNLDAQPESDECFAAEPLVVKDGGYEYHLPSRENQVFKTVVEIPSDVICKHCVLRWTYRAANSWGTCGDGTGAIGCGPQEHFRGCADVAILPLTNMFFNEEPQL